ncbi:hypothetical protein R1CP_35865 (plasmid) [Rhodococcus opacus]|uniref:Uncharacterized protein n=1 Tax=Rhodococcus opacus TaxID=37919 RepID=A0A1B1KGR5_RHOOP|nr:hypothetical protein [Rhodococcus opacus]ANS31779.1 hypothetical protein R1CP_35865 [Rhodococcus opacus]
MPGTRRHTPHTTPYLRAPRHLAGRRHRAGGWKVTVAEDDGALAWSRVTERDCPGSG